MKISELAKKMVLIIFIGSIISIIGGVIYYRSFGCLPFLFGVIIGGGASIIKVFMLERTVNRAVDMDGKTVGNFVRFQQLSRTFLTIIALVITAVIPGISLWGGAVGILLYPLSAYLLKFFVK